MDIKRLQERLFEIANKMRAIVDKAEEEDRGLTTDEREEWNAMRDDYDKVEGRMDDAIAASTLYDGADLGNEPEARALPGRSDTDGEGGGGLDPKAEAKKYDRAFDLWARHGMERLDTEQRTVIRDAEKRAQSAGTDTEGGFTVPEGFAGFVTERRLQFGAFRRAAGSAIGPTLLATGSGNNLPFPTLDDTGNVGAILGENLVDSEQDLVFGEIVLEAFKYTSNIIRVSEELLQDTEVPLEEIIGRNFGIRLGRITNSHYVTGTGTAQPQGITVAATIQQAAASSTAIAVADLINVKHSVDPAYRITPAYLFHDLTFRDLKLLEDTTNRPLWQPALGAEAPATIDGDPYIIDNDMPQIASGNRSVIYGMLSGYTIREVLALSMKRLVERYAEFHQVGFVAIMRADSDLIDTNSVAVLQH